MTRIVGQFSIEQWAGGWSATAQISSNEVMYFNSDTEEGAARKAMIAHDRGIVPMCAVPQSEYRRLSFL